MKLTENFINNSTRIWLAILLLGIGGVLAFLNIGRLEDPAFTIKTAVVIMFGLGFATVLTLLVTASDL